MSSAALEGAIRQAFEGRRREIEDEFLTGRPVRTPLFAQGGVVPEGAMQEWRRRHDGTDGPNRMRVHLGGQEMAETNAAKPARRKGGYLVEVDLEVVTGRRDTKGRPIVEAVTRRYRADDYRVEGGFVYLFDGSPRHDYSAAHGIGGPIPTRGVSGWKEFRVLETPCHTCQATGEEAALTSAGRRLSAPCGTCGGSGSVPSRPRPFPELIQNGFGGAFASVERVGEAVAGKRR